MILEINELVKVYKKHPQGSTENDMAIALIAKGLNSGQRDTLRALVECGPCFDGDVPSKTDRDELIHLGLASKAVIKNNQWGYTVATYFGGFVYKELV